MAASLAIHGAVLLLVNGDELPGSADSGVVEILLVSANRQQAAYLSPPDAAERQSQAKKDLPADGDEPAVSRPVAPQPQTAATASTAERADAAGRESLVRNHLEHFKYYPASARRRGISGEVEVAFELNSSGEAKLLKILSGSGYSLLDEAALETVHRAEPFPADGGAYQFVLRFRAS